MKITSRSCILYSGISGVWHQRARKNNDGTIIYGGLTDFFQRVSSLELKFFYCYHVWHTLCTTTNGPLVLVPPLIFHQYSVGLIKQYLRSVFSWLTSCQLLKYLKSFSLNSFVGFYSKITTQGRFEEAKYPELARLFFRTHFRPHNIFRILMIEYYEPQFK